jgi:hypothetical protein
MSWTETEIAHAVEIADEDARAVVEHSARRHNTISYVRDYASARGAHLRYHHDGPIVDGDDHPVDDLRPHRGDGS